MAALSLHVPGALGIGSLSLKSWFVAIAAVSAAVYLLAVMLITHRSGSRSGMWVVLLVAAALRLPLIVSPPFLSTDVYRYVWDGRVQAAGINPYRYLPADPALASLRDQFGLSADQPRRVCADDLSAHGANCFRRRRHVWSSVTGVKVLMVGFEVLAVFCLLRLLASAKLPAERVLIYAWNPLPVWAFSGNGHVDAAVIGLTGGCLAAAGTPSRRLGRRGDGLAILVKFLPAVVAPVFWRPAPAGVSARASSLRSWHCTRCTAAPAGHVSGSFRDTGPRKATIPVRASGFLPGWLGVVPLPAFAGVVYKAAVSILAGFGAWIAFVRRPDDAVSLCAAAGVMMALLRFRHQPTLSMVFRMAGGALRAGAGAGRALAVGLADTTLSRHVRGSFRLAVGCFCSGHRAGVCQPASVPSAAPIKGAT